MGLRKVKRCLEHVAEREQERAQLAAEQRQRELKWKERRAEGARRAE